MHETSAQKKQRLIRLLHVAKRELHLDDETYRAALMQATGKTSSKEMGIRELERVLDHFKKRGFVIKPKTKPQQHKLPVTALHPQDKKVRALWLEMHELGIVRDKSEYALSRYVKRLTGVDALNWTHKWQTSKVIESLKKWRSRVERQQKLLRGG